MPHLRRDLFQYTQVQVGRLLSAELSLKRNICTPKILYMKIPIVQLKVDRNKCEAIIDGTKGSMVPGIKDHSYS